MKFWQSYCKNETVQFSCPTWSILKETSKGKKQAIRRFEYKFALTDRSISKDWCTHLYNQLEYHLLRGKVIKFGKNCNRRTIKATSSVIYGASKRNKKKQTIALRTAFHNFEPALDYRLIAGSKLWNAVHGLSSVCLFAAIAFLPKLVASPQRRWYLSWL